MDWEGCCGAPICHESLITALAFRRAEKERIDWDRNILIFSAGVTVGLVALYVYGKATSRW